MMKPRRPHTKSRNGCKQCKKRRVKCDEQLPTCANCRIRQFECIYPQRANLPIPGSSLAQPHPILDSAPSQNPSPLIQTAAVIRIRELELMHQYSTKTCLSFSATAISSEIWRSFVVQEALQHDFLMDGLLGFASLHIATERPLEAENYVRSALEYQNRAFGSFRGALSNLTPENCNSLFAFSVLAMMGAITSRRFTEGANETSSTKSILLVSELLEGIRFVSKVGREWLQAGPFHPVFDLWLLPMSSIQDPSVDVALIELRAFNDSMRSMRIGEQHATFTAAIAHLQTCFSKDKEMVLIWLAMSGKDFMGELRREEPMAMLIFLHWGVLLDRLRDEWWANDSGKRLVEELSGRLRRCGEVWAGVTLRARHQCGLS